MRRRGPVPNGVAGLAPNVAFYLDDQPLSQPGRNLDVYAADLQRIEVLSGPQGTLFGASSQAGNVRLITNKPDLSGTFGNVRVGAGAVDGGDANSNVEAMLNLPLGENFAVRGVVYYDRKGGWIDNVAGTVDASESARFRPEGTVRDNGVPVSARRAGFQSSAATCADRGLGPACFDLSGVTFLEAENSDLVEEDFNETTYTGGRIAARWDLVDNWRFDASYATQDIESDGVFFADPNLGDLEKQPDRAVGGLGEHGPGDVGVETAALTAADPERFHPLVFVAVDAGVDKEGDLEIAKLLDHILCLLWIGQHHVTDGLVLAQAAHRLRIRKSD